MNDTESDLANMCVPQGSVLGPHLFLLYIKDLCNVIDKCKTFLYADDTVLVANDPDIYIVHMHRQSDLDNIANWCKDNKSNIKVRLRWFGAILRYSRRFVFSHLLLNILIRVVYR